MGVNPAATRLSKSKKKRILKRKAEQRKAAEAAASAKVPVSLTGSPSTFLSPKETKTFDPLPAPTAVTRSHDTFADDMIAEEMDLELPLLLISKDAVLPEPPTSKEPCLNTKTAPSSATVDPASDQTARQAGVNLKRERTPPPDDPVVAQRSPSSPSMTVEAIRGGAVGTRTGRTFDEHPAGNISGIRRQDGHALVDAVMRNSSRMVIETSLVSAPKIGTFTPRRPHARTSVHRFRFTGDDSDPETDSSEEWEAQENDETPKKKRKTATLVRARKSHPQVLRV